jgi:hypothetical protein
MATTSFRQPAILSAPVSGAGTFLAKRWMRAIAAGDRARAKMMLAQNFDGRFHG